MGELWSNADQIDNKKRTQEVILPLVDPFSQPYEAWTTRTPSIEEMMEAQRRTGKVSLHINDQLIARVTTGLEAANYIGSVGADNGLGNHINDALDNDSSYAQDEEINAVGVIGFPPVFRIPQCHLRTEGRRQGPIRHQ